MDKTQVKNGMYQALANGLIERIAGDIANRIAKCYEPQTVQGDNAHQAAVKLAEAAELLGMYADRFDPDTPLANHFDRILCNDAPGADVSNPLPFTASDDPKQAFRDKNDYGQDLCGYLA